MANYMTTDTELTAIANAIRNKASGGGRTGYRDYIMGLNNAASVDDPDAIIHVTYPEGCICTCTDGTTTITAPNTSGEVNFGVEIGTWIIKASNNNEKVSKKTIIIEQRREKKEIELPSIFLSTNFDGILNNTSWEDISIISQTGIGDNYWDIGDRKAITLNGKIGNYLTLSNYTTYVFILDFNHPVNKSTADNNIIFGGFKTALVGGVDICLVDSGYNTEQNSGIYFNINHIRVNSTYYNSNFGGWKGCDFRYDILGAVQTAPNPYNKAKDSFSTSGSDATTAAITSPKANTLMAALPSDFRSVLRLWTRWVDNKGGASNYSGNVTACVDAGISLLAEFEIFGSRSGANQYEQNHQKQMQYYTAGNSKVKYKHNDTTTTIYQWTSSAYYDETYRFCSVNPSGSHGSTITSYPHGLAPAFKV